MKTGDEVIQLKDFSALKGKHCESTAMMNALHYQGVRLSEAMINGLGASPGFVFNTEGDFPFLGLRQLAFKENFCRISGFRIQEGRPSNPQAAYDEVKAILKQNIPVILRVDMRYLPYRWGGKYGKKYTSFGWHFVTLVKIDEPAGIAWITETNEQGINPVEKISLRDLAKARDSREGELKADNYYYYFVDPGKNSLDYNRMLSESLGLLSSNYREQAILTGLDNFSGQILEIEKALKSKYMLPPVFEVLAGWIETFGTGGAGFRNFYRDYLIETAALTGREDAAACARSVDEACQKWTKLADTFKKLSQSLRAHYGDSQARKALYQEAAAQIREVYTAEKRMLEELEALAGQ